MSFLRQIEDDLIKAQRDKDLPKISILRFLLAKIHDAQIAKGKETPLTDEEILKEIAAEVRRHKESIEFAQKAGRADLAEIEQKELEILESYLPEKLSQEEVAKLVQNAISEVGAKTPSDFGKVMAVVMPKIAGRVEGATVGEIVKKALTK